MSARTLYLVRHGALAGDAALRFVGDTDLPLGAEGEAQALRLRAVLAGAEIGAAFSSDLERSRRTAELIVAGRNLAVEPRRALREPAMGAWEGRLRREVAAECPEDYRARGADLARHRVPGGESLDSCRRRVVAEIRRIFRATSGDVLVVGHASVNRVFLCHALGLPLRRMFRLGQDPGCLNLLRGAPGDWRVETINFRPPTPVSACRQTGATEPVTLDAGVSRGEARCTKPRSSPV